MDIKYIVIVQCHFVSAKEYPANTMAVINMPVLINLLMSLLFLV